MSFTDTGTESYYTTLGEITRLETFSNHLDYQPECFDDEPVYSIGKRSVYKRRVNEWLNKPTNMYIEDQFEFQDKLSSVLKQAHYVKKMLDELSTIIEDADLQVYDYKQFKEDFIHYIYTLSKL